MRRLSLIALIIIFLFNPNFVRGQTDPYPSLPDYATWSVVDASRIELRISDCASAYLGLEAEYENPDDLNEHVVVISRHIAVPISKCRKYNEKSLFETAASLYVQKEESDLLVERSKQSDSFLYIRWRVKKDLRMGLDIVDGDVEIWFLPAQGYWIFVKNQKVNIEFLTENIGNGKSHNVFSGMKYQVGGVYHILRISRDDIINLAGENK